MYKMVPYEWREILDIFDDDSMPLVIFNAYGPFAVLLYKRLLNLSFNDQIMKELKMFDKLQSLNANIGLLDT